MKTNTLKNKNFLLIVIGQVISLFGNGILRFALPLYLLKITDSPSLFGIVSALSFLPLIALMPIGGIIADRVNKKNIMVTLDLLTGILMLIFLNAMNIVSLVPLLIITMMALYSIAGLYQPSVNASMPSLLNENVLAKGNGLVSSINALSNLLSPIIGGILFSKLGIKPILTTAIICFFLSALLEVFIKIPSVTTQKKKSMIKMVTSDLRSGCTFIFLEKPILAKLILITCILNAFLSSMIIIAQPVLITQSLGLSDELYGLSQGVLALGGILAGILTGVLGSKVSISNLPKWFLFTALSLIPLTTSMLFSSQPLVSFALITLSSFFVMIFATLASIQIITYVQKITKEELQGKVIALLMTFAMCANPLGQLIYGYAFEYAIGFESTVILVSVLISLFIGLYSKKVLKDSE